MKSKKSKIHNKKVHLYKEITGVYVEKVSGSDKLSNYDLIIFRYAGNALFQEMKEYTEKHPKKIPEMSKVINTLNRGRNQVNYVIKMRQLNIDLKKAALDLENPFL